MPQLIDIRKTKKIELPSYPGSEVEIYDSVLVKDSIELDISNMETKEYSKLLVVFIKSWNFTGADDKLLPITKENINLLKDKDAAFIMNEVAAFAKDLKKN